MATARIQAILAREAATAVVFRRGPTDRTAVIGWDLKTDTFKVGQWFRGSFYGYRSDLSPDGKHLIYFAGKYQRAVRDEMAGKSTWTAVSRVPYLKAIDLWFNGTASGWNGGGHFIDNRSVALNRPSHGELLPHEGVGRFKVVQPTEQCVRSFGWGMHGGECPQAYLPRLIRDGWSLLGEDDAGWTLQRLLRNGLVLQKRFLVGTGEGHGIYWERHEVCDEKGEVVVDGSNWGWADWDAPRKRIVFAEDGMICSLALRENRSRKILFDCNALKYERRLAPY